MEVRATQSVTRPLRGTTPLASPVTQRETAVLEQAPQTRTFDLSDNPDYQRLKAEGKLTPEVMAQLKLLATEPLAKGINRTELISGALAELADPSSIRQGDRDTCAATVVQSQLAEDQPAEYLRLIAGLASPAGKATLANGDTIQRDSDWGAPSGRSLIGNLMQPAFMAYAAGGYDNATDTRRTDAGKGQGLYAGEQNKLEDAVTGKQTVTVFGNGSDMAHALKAAIALGQSVPVIVTAKDPVTGKLQAHSLLIERIEGDQVTYLDPKGKRKTASLSDLMAHLQSADVPPRCASPALLKASQGHDRGVLAGDGWWSGLVGAVTGAVAAVSSAVGNAVSTAANAVNDHVVQPIVQPVVSLVQGAVATANLWSEIVGPVAATMASSLASSFVQGIQDFGKAVWDGTVASANWVIANQGAIVTGLGIACAVIPGLQPLALVIAAAQGLSAVAEIVKGAQDRDWKEALSGVTALLQAAATAFGGGYLAQALGKAAAVTARVLGGLARVAKAGVDLAQTLGDKADARTRVGKGFAFVADLLGGSVGAIEDKAGDAASKFASIADQASKYYDKASAIYGAITDPNAWNVGRGLDIGQQLLNLAGDVNSDAQNGMHLEPINGPEHGRWLTHTFQSFAGYAGSLASLDRGIESKDWRQAGADLVTAATLGGQFTQDVANGWVPDATAKAADIVSGFRRAADYAKDIDALLTKTDVQSYATAGYGLIHKSTDDTGVQWYRMPVVQTVDHWLLGRKVAAVKWGTEVENSAIKWALGVEQGAIQWAKDYAVEAGWAPAPDAVPQAQ